MLCLTYALDYANKAMAATNYMRFWKSSVTPSIWISIILIVPILLNFFDVRRYGEIQYWLTTIVGLIILGISLSMGCAPGPLLTGTNSQYCLMPCPGNDMPIGACISPLALNISAFKA